MQLPPLNAVRVFEAAGRLENFSQAAAELKVTPGAVSRQVRKLEDHLGANLFARLGAEVKLTDLGRVYLGAVRDALERLDVGTRQIRSRHGAKLHIWGSRFFIRLWLIPRLPDFHQRFPEQEVMITTAGPTEPMPSDFDVAIRLGDGVWPGHKADLLIPRVFVPVCSPAYLRAAPPLNTPADLETHMLLDTPGGAQDWTRWYAVTGDPPVSLSQRMTFTSTDTAYSAALDGVGIVLGRRGFFESDVARGALVQPFDASVEADDGFYLIYHERRPVPAHIARFRTWIIERLRRDAIR